MESKNFVCRSQAALKALPHWLKKRKDVNSWSLGHEDKNGNPFIGLTYDRNLDSDWSKDWEKRGLIFCNSETVFEADKILQSHAIKYWGYKNEEVA